MLEGLWEEIKFCQCLYVYKLWYLFSVLLIIWYAVNTDYTYNLSFKCILSSICTQHIKLHYTAGKFKIIFVHLCMHKCIHFLFIRILYEMAYYKYCTH